MCFRFLIAIKTKNNFFVHFIWQERHNWQKNMTGKKRKYTAKQHIIIMPNHLESSIASVLEDINDEFKMQVQPKMNELKDTMYHVNFLQADEELKEIRKAYLVAHFPELPQIYKISCKIRMEKEEELDKILAHDIGILQEALDKILANVNNRREIRRYNLELMEKKETRESNDLLHHLENKVASKYSNVCLEIQQLQENFSKANSTKLNAAVTSLMNTNKGGSNLKKGDIFQNGNVQITINQKPRGISVTKIRKILSSNVDKNHNNNIDNNKFECLDGKDVTIEFSNSSFIYSTSGQEFTKEISNLVWAKHMGANTERGKCPVCLCDEISKRNFETGHIQSKFNKGSGELENGIPVCCKCNVSMGSQSLWKYVRETYPENTKLLEQEAKWNMHKQKLNIDNIMNAFLDLQNNINNIDDNIAEQDRTEFEVLIDLEKRNKENILVKMCRHGIQMLMYYIIHRDYPNKDHVKKIVDIFESSCN